MRIVVIGSGPIGTLYGEGFRCPVLSEMPPRRLRPQARGEAPATQPSTGLAAVPRRPPRQPAVLSLR